MQNRQRPRQISYTAIGENRGNKRAWLQGLRLEQIGFEIGQRYNRHYDEEQNRILLTLDPQGSHVVSGKNLNGFKRPVIDIENQQLTRMFERYKKSRVLYYDNHLVLSIHPEEMTRAQAWEDLLINLEGGCLTTGTICVGGGISSSAIKDGLMATGYDTHTEWVIDIEPKYLQSAIDNSRAIDDETIIVCGSLNDVETSMLTPVNLLNISLPCTGLSPSGRSKNRLKHPEDHETAGTAVLRAIDYIETNMPPMIWNENVKEFASSATGALFANRLRELGYNVQSGFYGGEMGTIEDRYRSITLATHPDLDIDLDQLVPVMTKQGCVNDILEDIAPDDPAWRTFDYLHAKEERDIANGKGYRQQLIEGHEDSIGVMGRGYRKGRSTEARKTHPTDPTLSRLFTPVEMARLQQVPEELIANLCDTTASEILGQGVSYPLFVAMGQFTGKALDNLRGVSPSVAKEAVYAPSLG